MPGSLGSVQLVNKDECITCILYYYIVIYYRYPYGIYPVVHAPYNWWGRGDVPYVAGRIWERRDDDNLIEVQYQPPLKDNSSVLEGQTGRLLFIYLLFIYLFIYFQTTIIMQ